MKVAEDSKFNMWNTNGRRKDITDAYTKYLTILNEEFESGNYEWDSFPKVLDNSFFICLQSNPVQKFLKTQTNWIALINI